MSLTLCQQKKARIQRSYFSDFSDCRMGNLCRSPTITPLELQNLQPTTAKCITTQLPKTVASLMDSIGRNENGGLII